MYHLRRWVSRLVFISHVFQSFKFVTHDSDNWQKEFETWCPTMKVLNYYGSQDERRHMRLQIVQVCFVFILTLQKPCDQIVILKQRHSLICLFLQDQIEYDVILTTYNMVISSPEDRILFKWACKNLLFFIPNLYIVVFVYFLGNSTFIM